MKTRLFLITLLFVQFAFISCKDEQPKEIDKSSLLADLKELSSDAYEGRGFTTEGNKKAQQYIAKRFEEIGVTPYLESGFIQQFEQTLAGRRRQRLFPITNAAKDFSNVPDTLVTGGNVVAQIKGQSEKTIVITGHLDHLGIRNGQIYNGADDDASGTAALLALAEYFKDSNPKHTLVFAAVDAEEVGMYGSSYFVENHPDAKQNIAMNINMDMIAHNDKNELYACGTYHYPQLKPQLENIDSSINLLLGHDDPNNKELDDWTYSSDHRNFHKEKIPFIYFGVEDHKDYHKPTDTFENINQDFYYEAVKLIAKVIEQYDATL
jgi:aminopeptidase-like protein